MSRRPLLLLPALLAALALPVAPALAGEDPPEDPTAPTPVVTPAPGTDPVSAPAVGTATLRAQNCVSRSRAHVTVTGRLIDSVVFVVGGHRVDTDSDGDYSYTMKCARWSVGAHRAKAVVSFQQGASPASRTLRFQITRSLQGTARFAG
jgi:hypothetical protein